MNKVQLTNSPLPKPDTDLYFKGRRIPKQYMEVAEGMETQFINQMLDELNKSELNEEEDSFSTQYYKSLLNHERAKIMAANERSVGLKEVILDQLLPEQTVRKANPNSINAYQAISIKGGENE